MSSTHSVPSISSSVNQNQSMLLKENVFHKSNKTTFKALFKSLQIYRTNFVKSNFNSTKANFNASYSSNTSECAANAENFNNLTIIYIIKEKKQKSNKKKVEFKLLL